MRREAGALVRVYSGSSGAARMHRREHVPITMLDLALEPGATLDQELPAAHNGFVYALEGSVRIGACVREGQIGWLDRSSGHGPSVVRIAAGSSGARVVLCRRTPGLRNRNARPFRRR